MCIIFVSLCHSCIPTRHIFALIIMSINLLTFRSVAKCVFPARCTYIYITERGWINRHSRYDHVMVILRRSFFSPNKKKNKNKNDKNVGIYVTILFGQPQTEGLQGLFQNQWNIWTISLKYIRIKCINLHWYSNFE